MSLDPVRQQEQIQIWDKEDAELARKEEEERKRVEAEVRERERKWHHRHVLHWYQTMHGVATV